MVTLSIADIADDVLLGVDLMLTRHIYAADHNVIPGMSEMVVDVSVDSSH